MTGQHDSLQNLLRAIEQAERGPQPGDLDGAPLLINWFLRSAGNTVIVAEGEVRGHPEIDDPWMTTSPVLGFNGAAGWMRTRSRWYRLGQASGLMMQFALTGAQQILAQTRAAALADAAGTDATEAARRAVAAIPAPSPEAEREIQDLKRWMASHSRPDDPNVMSW